MSPDLDCAKLRPDAKLIAGAAAKQTAKGLQIWMPAGVAMVTADRLEGRALSRRQVNPVLKRRNASRASTLWVKALDSNASGGYILNKRYALVPPLNTVSLSRSWCRRC
jgi:hypothetical protein